MTSPTPFSKYVSQFLVYRSANRLDHSNVIETVSVGEHFNTSDHQVARWRLVMEQAQEVKTYVKRPNFSNSD